MSEMRGTISASPDTMARRSALETTFSMTVIGMRCDTPDRLSMRRSLRASNAMRSITSAMKSGTRTARLSRSVHASCRVMSMPELDGRRIVRHDLAADAILERRDDLAARRVVLGVRREAELHVERKADRDSL